MKALALVCCLSIASAAQAAAEPGPVEAGQLEQPVAVDSSADRVGRVAAEMGAALLAAALPNFLYLPFVFAGGGGAASQIAPIMGLIAVSAIPATIPTGVWLVHKKMGGQGLWPAAFGGTMLGLVLGGAVLGFYAWGTDFKVPGHYTALVITGAAVIAVAAAVFAIELHNDSILSSANLSASIVPLPGGAMGAISARF